MKVPWKRARAPSGISRRGEARRASAPPRLNWTTEVAPSLNSTTHSLSVDGRMPSPCILPRCNFVLVSWSSAIVHHLLECLASNLRRLLGLLLRECHTARQDMLLPGSMQRLQGLEITWSNRAVLPLGEWQQSGPRHRR